MPAPLLTCLFLLFAFQLSAQTVTVDREMKSDKDGSKAIYSAKNTSFGKQTICLELNQGSYARANSPLPVVRTLLPGNNRLVELSDVKNAPGYGFTSVGGCLDTEHADITYLLPIAPGKTTRVDTLYNIESTYFGEAPPVNWTAYQFSATPGDSVFAARRGTVIEIKTVDGQSAGQGIAYSSFHTSLLIEHEDCTRGRYQLLDPERLFVQEGDRVEAGTALGIVDDGEGYLGGCQLRFSVYYPALTRAGMLERRRKPELRFSNHFVIPEFHGIGVLEATREYTGAHAEEAIIQEMSRREVKRWRKGVE